MTRPIATDPQGIRYKTRVEYRDPDSSLLPENGWDGFNIKWLIDEQSMGATLGSLGYAFFPPGSQHKLHVHEDAEELTIYLRGRGKRVCGDQVCEVGAGDILFTPRGQVHGITSLDPNEPIELWCFYAGAPNVEKTGYSLAAEPENIKKADSSFKLRTRVEFRKPDQGLKAEDGWDGFNMRWLIDDKTMGATIGSLGYAVFPHGTQHKLHKHDNAEEYTVYLRGRGIRVSGDQEYEVKPGDVVFTPRGVVHGLKSVDPNEPIELWCFFAGAPSIEKTGYSVVSNK
ncbi:MAG TPA: cupin domain-containing protein [Clostridia bacterium]|nr:cupin domain-containing protein [Clostridia bacterium]